MSRNSKTSPIGALSLALTVSATGAVLITRAHTGSREPKTQAAVQRPSTRVPRNLFLRPEALSVSRRLGNRFKPSSRAVTNVVGNLIIGGSQQAVSLVRRQTETGETVELVVGSRGLAWSERQGIRTSSLLPTETERLLVERLILDSPDQFLLAQLRGASYFTIARNVRPNDASDDYSGPLWNLVRVAEPPQDESVRPRSTWRIYYLNVQTGLPDRVEYQLNGQEIRAEILGWSEQDGEKTPAHMKWSSGGQIIMEYRVSTVSHIQ